MVAIILLVLQLFRLNRYLSAQKLPLEMIELRKRYDCSNVSGEDGGSDLGEDYVSDKGTWAALQKIDTFPYEVGDLQILSLGKFLILLALCL